MKIIKVKITDLISPDYNPRRKLTPDDAEYQRIKRSIEQWGYVDPVIFNKRTRHIVGGNQRWQVLRDLGKTTIDAVEVDLDDTNERALNVALNKITGDWDMRLLQEVLGNLSDSGMDITLTGFDPSFLLPPVEDALAEYQGMPEYSAENQSAYRTLYVHFDSEDDVQAFAKLIGDDSISDKTKWIWYPRKLHENLQALKYE
jgi:ParB-like chromosome segregation protein Spo0J